MGIPYKEIDSVKITAKDMHYLLVDELLDYDILTSSPSGTNFINKKLPSDLVNSKFYGVKMEPNGTNAKRTGKKRVRTTMNRADREIKCNKKYKLIQIVK